MWSDPTCRPNPRAATAVADAAAKPGHNDGANTKSMVLYLLRWKIPQVLAGSEDKAARKKVHEAVRKHFEGFDSDTVDDPTGGTFSALLIFCWYAASAAAAVSVTVSVSLYLSLLLHVFSRMSSSVSSYIMLSLASASTRC